MKLENGNTIRTIGINVLIEIPKVEEKTKGGILLPEDTKDTQQLCGVVGKIVNMGEIAFLNVNGDDFIPDKPKVGDWVYINQHAGNDIEIEDKLYRMIVSNEIRGIVEVKEKIE